jgi:hypothetical protein
LKAVTTIIPIAFVNAGDPIAFRLNRPNGNVTGIRMITAVWRPSCEQARARTPVGAVIR